MDRLDDESLFQIVFDFFAVLKCSKFGAESTFGSDLKIDLSNSLIVINVGEILIFLFQKYFLNGGESIGFPPQAFESQTVFESPQTVFFAIIRERCSGVWIGTKIILVFGILLLGLELVDGLLIALFDHEKLVVLKPIPVVLLETHVVSGNRVLDSNERRELDGGLVYARVTTAKRLVHRIKQLVV